MVNGVTDENEGDQDDATPKRRPKRNLTNALDPRRRDGRHKNLAELFEDDGQRKRVVAGGHDDTLRAFTPEVAADWEPTVLPLTGISLNQARTKITALHFAKEALSDGEFELLAIAEGLLRLLDIAQGGTAR